MDLASLVWPFVMFERKGNEMHVKLPNYLFQTGAGKTTCTYVRNSEACTEKCQVNGRRYLDLCLVRC